MKRAPVAKYCYELKYLALTEIMVTDCELIRFLGRENLK